MFGEVAMKFWPHRGNFFLRTHSDLAGGTRSCANEAWNQRTERQSGSVPDKSPAGNLRQHRISLLEAIWPDPFIALVC